MAENFKRSQSSAVDKQTLSDLSDKPYAMQAKHFLNAFFDRQAGGVPEGGFSQKLEEAEKIWAFTAEFIKLDKKKNKDGNELDEFEAHQFLEHTVGALTVKDMRTALKEIDIDFNRMMSPTEFLIYHYKLTESDWVYLVNWVPTSSPEHRAMMERLQDQMANAQEKLRLSTEAAEAAAKAATASEAAAKEAEEATKALQALQQAKADAIAAQEALSVDESLSTVKRSKAKAQCAILKSEDSQPLRTAEITAGAAERKAKKAAKAAKKMADDAEAAMKAADEAVHEVTNELEEAKAAAAGGGSENGTFWWLDREFEEALKYMGPKQKAKAEAARAASRKRSGTTV